MHLLLAQVPQANPNVQVVQLGAGFYAVAALMGLVGLVSLVCFILVVVKMFQNGQTGLGVACLILTVCTGIGPLIAFIVGWMNSAAWGIKNIMMAWTVVFILYFVLLIAFFS